MSNLTSIEDTIVVAGEAADGHGVYAGHREGTGPMTYERYLELTRRAGLPEEWLQAPKGAKTQLTRAVRAIATRNRMLAQQGQRMLTEVRPYSIRWLLIGALTPAEAPEAIDAPLDTEAFAEALGVDATIRAELDGVEPTESTESEAQASDSLVGRAFGTVMLQVTLYDTPSPTGEGRQVSIEYRGDESLANQVRAQYEAFVGSQLLQAEDITHWLNRTFRDRLKGVISGAAWYIPRDHRATVEAITDAFANHGNWGSGWFNPPVPCATSRQLGVSMAKTLCAELGFHLGELAKAREVAAAKGEADITAKRAEGFAIRLARVKARIDYHARSLGDAYAECVAAYDDAMISLDTALEGGATVDGNIRDLLKEQAAALSAKETAFVAPGPEDQLTIPFEDIGDDGRGAPYLDGVSFTDEHTSNTEITDLGGFMY